MESHIPHVDIKITFLLCCYYIIFPLFMLCGQPLWYIASKPAIHKIIIFVFFPENCVGQTSWHKRFRKLFPTCLEKFLAQPTSTAIFLLNCRDVLRFGFQVVLLIIIFHSQDLLSRNVLSNVFSNFSAHLNWIFMEDEGDEIKSKQASKRDRTLPYTIFKDY